MNAYSATPILNAEFEGSLNSIFNYTLTENALAFNFDFTEGVNLVGLYLGNGITEDNSTFNFENFLCDFNQDYLICNYNTPTNLDSTKVFSGEIIPNTGSQFDLTKGLDVSNSITFAIVPIGPSDFEISQSATADIIPTSINPKPPIHEVSTAETLGILGFGLGALAFSRREKPQITSKYNL